jgi:exosortase E/protease (VPEID-CTERM system)
LPESRLFVFLRFHLFRNRISALAIETDSPSKARAPTKWWLIARACFLFVLLLAEILALSLVYDFALLQTSALFPLRVAGYATAIFRVVAISLVVLAVIERRQLPAILREWEQLTSRDRLFVWMLIGHFAAAACFVGLSQHVMRANGNDATTDAAWIWLTAGVVTFILWLTSLAPIRFWREIWRRLRVASMATSLILGLAIHFFVNAFSELWFPLSSLTLSLSKWLLALITDDIVTDPVTRELGTSRFHAVIAPQCSGYEGIGLISAAITVLLLLFRKEFRFPRALLLLPIGIVTIWLFNAVRIVVLILIGSYVSPEIAVGGFHSQAGWVGFAAVTLVISFVALRSPLFTKHQTRQASKDSNPERPSAAYLLPLLATIAAAMIASAFSSGFDALYPVKILTGSIVLACFFPVYRSIPRSWSWLAAMWGTVVFAIWLCLEPLTGGDGTSLANAFHQLPAVWAIVWLGFRVVGSTVIVPIVEELAFRGYLMRRITSADFETISYQQVSWFAMLLSSVLFGLLHGQWLAGTTAGIFYAMATRRRNLLCDAIVAHGVTNGLIAIYVLSAGAWRLWS